METKFNVVLVADRLYTDDINTEFDASDLEKISDEYYYGLYEELKKVCGGTVFHYQSPKDLADNAYKHKDDIVFTIYGGEKSRNRHMPYTNSEVIAKTGLLTTIWWEGL